jgi:hypothetical protein
MGTAPPRPAPVFLIAAARTGSATLRHMLAHHRDIAFAPEFDFLVEAISPEGRFMKREAFLRSVEFNMAFKRLGLTIPQGLPFAGIARNFMEQVAATKPGAVVVGATIQHDFDRLLWLWPDARFIHLVRDGRDVAYAYVLAGKAGNLWHGIADWVQTEMLWDRMSHKLPPDRQFTIKYEVLASETEYELRRLCQFLGLGFDPAMFEQAGAPPRRELGRWRKADIAELSAAEHRAARWLLQNSYFLSGTVRPPSILRRIALNLQNKLAITNRKRDLLGTRLWLKAGFIERFGGKKARDRMKRQQSELLAKGEE